MSIEAMKQDGYCQRCGGKGCVACDAREQEPVAWGVDWGKAGDTPCVSIIKRKANGVIEVMAVEYAPYTHPKPKREWVGLTDEEIGAVDWKSNETLHDFAHAIEAKLKEKNT